MTFYQSAICPRCILAKLFLGRLKSEFPDVEVEKVEVLGNSANRAAMENDGIKQFPALVYGDKKISGFLLNRAAIRSYLASL